MMALSLSIIWHSKFLSNTFVFFIRSTGIWSRGKNLLVSLHTSTWFFETNCVDVPEPTSSDSVWSSHSPANKNFSVGVMLSNIFRAPVGLPGKADIIIRQASLAAPLWVSSLNTFCWDRQPRTHAYDIIGRIIAVCIYPFHQRWFYSLVLPTICLYCINAVVALLVIWVICDFQVSLLSRVTPNSLASFESSSFDPFIDKQPKSGFRLWVNSTILVFLLLNCSSCYEAQFKAIFIAFWTYLWFKAYQHLWQTLLDHQHSLNIKAPAT